jgi:hypothetical protein
LRCFSAQLWKGDQPAGLLGLGGQFVHPDDVLDAVDEFLAEQGESALTDQQLGRLGGMLIMAKGGPDAAILQLAIEDPSTVLPLF